jgi:hypothetical protein
MADANHEHIDKLHQAIATLEAQQCDLVLRFINDVRVMLPPGGR